LLPKSQIKYVDNQVVTVVISFRSINFKVAIETFQTSSYDNTFPQQRSDQIKKISFTEKLLIYLQAVNLRKNLKYLLTLTLLIS
jgi:hypothetical protein